MISCRLGDVKILYKYLIRVKHLGEYVPVSKEVLQVP